jgi:glutamine---fructose-6-phosphate transaminase (isomerizing)
MSGDTMLAEMRQQPAVLADLAARWRQVRELVTTTCRAGPPSGVTFVARGSSDNAAVLGRYLVEIALQRPATLAAPSIITRYDAPVDYRGWLAVALSQSGATPEVVTVIDRMGNRGATTIGVSNEVDCPLRDVVDLLLGCGAGPELAVPATKTVTAQMVLMVMLAAALGPVAYGPDDLQALHLTVAGLLDDIAPVRRLARRWADAERLFVVGRGLLYAAALETALKVKETTGVLAEGLSAADLLHGPVAAIGPATPVLLIDGGGPTTDDISSVAALLSARGVDVALLSPDSRADVGLLAPLPEALHAVTATVRGQQLAYEIAECRGMDPDRPLGLSKITATS